MHSGAGDTTQLVPGSPIRTPWDHSSVDSSPRPIAASHVLHRLLVPRHPPCALTNLTTKMLASTVQFSTNNTHTPGPPPPHTGHGQATTAQAPKTTHPPPHPGGTAPHTRSTAPPGGTARACSLRTQQGAPPPQPPPPGAETADRPPAGSPPPPTPPHHPTPTGQQPADHHQAATHHNHHQSTLVDRNGWTGRCRGFLRGAP
jgi:hypothetical protein